MTKALNHIGLQFNFTILQALNFTIDYFHSRSHEHLEIQISKVILRYGQSQTSFVTFVDPSCSRDMSSQSLK